MPLHTHPLCLTQAELFSRNHGFHHHITVFPSGSSHPVYSLLSLTRTEQNRHINNGFLQSTDCNPKTPLKAPKQPAIFIGKISWFLMGSQMCPNSSDFLWPPGVKVATQINRAFFYLCRTSEKDISWEGNHVFNCMLKLWLQLVANFTIYTPQGSCRQTQEEGNDFQPWISVARIYGACFTMVLIPSGEKWFFFSCFSSSGNRTIIWISICTHNKSKDTF